MSSFVFVSKPFDGCIAFDEQTKQRVTLVDKILTENHNDNFWIATDQNDNIIIVDEFNRSGIGYYGD